MRRIVSSGLLAALMLVEHSAVAQHVRRIRRRFEPTDLDLRGAGTTELDVQTGFVEGASSNRIVAPDIEAIVGIGPNAQIQIDTTLGFDSAHGSKFRFLDNTWASLKLGIFDSGDDDDDSVPAWAGGIQAGPKLPTTAWSRSLGAEAIAIVGRSVGRLHVFAQGGVLLDPYVTVPNARDLRPFAAEGGVDLSLGLDTNEKWELKAELGGAHYFSPATTELHGTGGIAHHPAPWLELSVIGIAGLGPGDRLGLLFGVAPRFDLLGRRK